MIEIACAECGKMFAARSSRARMCSKNCQMRNWRGRNLEHARAYMKAWASKNPEALARHNEQRRKGWAHMQCVQCNAPFQRTSGASKYCSLNCRYKARYVRPGEKEKAIARSSIWTKANRERVRAYGRKHYKKHAVEKLHTQPWHSLLLGRSRDAKKKGIVFELTPEWAAARWKNCCELTSITFAPPEQRVGYKNRNFSPSIDKIEPAKGYTQANSRFVIWAVNSLKRDGTDEQMYRIAAALIQNRPTSVEGILSLPG